MIGAQVDSHGPMRLSEASVTGPMGTRNMEPLGPARGRTPVVERPHRWQQPREGQSEDSASGPSARSWGP